MLGKGTAEEGLLLPVLFAGSSLKDVVMSYKRFEIGNGFSMKGLDVGFLIKGG